MRELLPRPFGFPFAIDRPFVVPVGPPAGLVEPAGPVALVGPAAAVAAAAPGLVGEIRS